MIPNKTGTIGALLFFMILGFGVVQILFSYNENMPEKEHWFLYGLLGSVITCIYLFPFLVAVYLRHPGKWRLLAANVLLGITGFGWLGCIYFAFKAKHQ